MKTRKTILIVSVTIAILLIGLAVVIIFTGNQKTRSRVSEEEKAEIEEFIGFFTEYPVLNSFDQSNTSEVVRFALYKLEYLEDEQLIYDEGGRYYVNSDYVLSFIGEYFDVTNVEDYSDNEIKYKSHDIATYSKIWRPAGGTPIIDYIEKTDDTYIIGGHLDIPVAVNGKDSDLPKKYFNAVITKDANGRYRLYEFRSFW